MEDFDAHTPPPANGATGDVMQAYTKVWPHLRMTVEHTARELTKDRDEQNDLIQEARVALWQIDASRCDVRNREDLLYVRKVLKQHMKKVATAMGLVLEVSSSTVPEDVMKRLS